MSIGKIRVFVKATGYTPTDELAFIGSPPAKEFLPFGDYEVDVSVVWTWDVLTAKRLVEEWSKYYRNVNIGGPAFDDAGGPFVSGRYIRKEIVFTSRGCDRQCSWCYVHKREGKSRELKIEDGYVIEDSNLLMCSKKHVVAVFDMLRRNQKEAFFNGGFDARLFKKWHVDLLETVKVGEIYFACDSKKVFSQLRKIIPLLIEKPLSWRFCYVLLGYKETIKQARERLVEIKKLGFVPIPMLYQKNEFIHYSQEWKNLEREYLMGTRYMRMVNEWQKEVA